MTENTIAFIGGGNMAASMIGGLIADGFDPARIRVADPDENKLDRFSSTSGVTTTASNAEAVTGASVVVLAVKPQVLGTVSQELASTVQSGNPLVVSIAAGIREADLGRWLSPDNPIAIVRTMPNTPALVQTGATVLYANAQVSYEQRNLAESIMRAVGMTVWIDDEEKMDAVTALSGSGPAYFFLLMEILESAGVDLGLPRDTARLLTLQTGFGATKMALESDEDPASLRERVTSPGGTTEQALKVLREMKIDQAFKQALQAACERSKELAVMLGDK